MQMSHMLAMLLEGEAEALRKTAATEPSIFGRVAGALGSEGLMKQAMFFRPRPLNISSEQASEPFLSGDSPIVGHLRDFMRDHPPENMQALRDLYAQATERALQVALSKMETGEDADPMGLALKNLRRMADLLETRLDTLRAQREIRQFQQELAMSQGLSPTNPALQATQNLPAAVSPPMAAEPAGAGPPAPPPAPVPPQGTEPPVAPAM
jgi:hypothetical protein